MNFGNNLTTRRGWIAAAGVACLTSAACSRRAGSGFPGYALVATSGEKSVSVIDLLHFRVLAPIELGAAPSAVVPAGDGSAFVLTPETGCVHRINDSLAVTGSTCLASKLAAIRMDAGSANLFAISSESPELIQARKSDLRVQRRIGLRERARTFDVFGEADNQMVATASGESGMVELFHLSSGGRYQQRLNGSAGQLRFRADGQLLLVANRSTKSLIALSLPKLEVIAELPLAMQPDNLCFSRDGGQLFVSGAGMDGIAIVFPYRVLQVDQTVLAGRNPGVMACSENPSLLFVASASGTDVCILYVNTRRVVALVDVAEHPGYITMTPDDQYALILSEEAGSVAMIRVPAVRVNPAMTREKSGAALFTMLPVGRAPVHTAVIRRHL